MAQTTVNAARSSESWLVVAAACISTFVVAYNSTAILTALPAIKSSLDMDAEGLQWVMNAYMLASAVLVAVMGRFADIFGKMQVFLIGLGIFAVGSIGIIFADNAAMMLIGRTCQGVGAAAIFSTSVALIAVASPEEKRAQALGLWAGMVAFGFGVGPLIGGIFTDFVSWRGIFVVDILILAITVLLYLRIEKLGLVEREIDPSTRIDYWGAALLVMTLGSFVYGLTNGHQAGWTSLETLGLFAIAIIGATAFAFNERRSVEPLINFSFFRSPRYSAAAIGMFLTGFVLIGVLYYYNIFVQSPGAQDYSAVEAGLSLQSAHVDCYGERAVDAFYVSDANGGKLVEAPRISALRDRQVDALPDSAVNGVAGGRRRVPAERLTTASASKVWPSQKPLTGRAFADLVAELDLYAFIRTQVESRGRYGRRRKIFLAIDGELCAKVYRIIMVNFGIQRRLPDWTHN